MVTEFWSFIGDIYIALSGDIFFNVAVLLTLGIIGGNIAHHYNLPRVTGYILVGILFGPSGFSIINQDFLYEIKIIKSLTLGFIGFNIGMELKRSRFVHEGNRIIFLTFFQALFTFVVVFGIVYLIAQEHKLVYALLLASISTVTTPAPIFACMRSYHTKGKLSELICPIVAIDDIIGIILFSLALPFSIYLAGHEGEIVSVSSLVLGPFLNIAFSIIMGSLLGIVASKVLKIYRRADNISTVLVLFTGVLFAVGIGETFDTSDILLPLVMGMTITNSLPTPTTDRLKLKTDAIVLPLLLVFFTVSGADLDVTKLPLIGFIGIFYVTARTFGKLLGSTLGARMTREPKNIQKYLGLTLIPQGGVALDMAILVEVRFLQVAQNTGEPFFSDIGTTIFTVILSTVILYKIVGEIIVRRAFIKAGEIDSLIDEEIHVV